MEACKQAARLGILALHLQTPDPSLTVLFGFHLDIRKGMAIAHKNKVMTCEVNQCLRSQPRKVSHSRQHEIRGWHASVHRKQQCPQVVTTVKGEQSRGRGKPVKCWGFIGGGGANRNHHLTSLVFYMSSSPSSDPGTAARTRNKHTSLKFPSSRFLKCLTFMA